MNVPCGFSACACKIGKSGETDPSNPDEIDPLFPEQIDPCFAVKLTPAKKPIMLF